MAIKSKQIPAKEPKVIAFPKLMIRPSTGNIVLFERAQVGVIVYNGSVLDQVGSYSNSWNMTVFEDYDGEIILRNK